MGASSRRIDLHYHIIPPPYVDALSNQGITGSTFVKFPRWTPRKALSHMARSEVEVAITSLSTPGVWFGDAVLARQLSRLCNEFQAQMKVDHPGRFGSFAFLPLPDVEGALVELDYALDQLGHDGVVLLTDIDGRYLGAPNYEELFAEMDRREVVVFIHPHTEPNRRRRYELFHPLLEWPIHTTRAAIDLLYSGRLRRYPNIRYVLAHGGGTVPYLSHRIACGALGGDTADQGEKRLDALPSDELAGELDLLRGLFYDTASPGEAHLASIQEFVGARQVVFGTDGGWTPPVQTAISIKTLEAYEGFDRGERIKIERENAVRLFPQFADNDLAVLVSGGEKQ